MIIRAKEGTLLEEKLRELHAEFISEKERAVARAQEIFGQKPIMMPYAWAFGFCYIYEIRDRDFVFESPLQNPPPYIKEVGEKRYRLSLRHKASRDFIKQYDQEFKGLKPNLKEFGIHTILNGRYAHWQVIKEKTGRFVFIAPDWGFTGESREQYEIILDSEIARND